MWIKHRYFPYCTYASSNLSASLLTRSKKFRLTRKKCFTSKTEEKKILYVWPYVLEYQLLWFDTFCEKWMWNNRLLDIWLTLGHIRKVAIVKSPTRPRLSCWCHPGSSSTRTVFYLSSRTEYIPPSAYCWRSGTDTFSRIRSVTFCVTKFSYKNCLLESHLPIIMLVL